MSEAIGKTSRNGRRLARLLAFLVASLALGIATDAWRKERVFFPKKDLPVFESVPGK